MTDFNIVAVHHVIDDVNDYDTPGAAVFRYGLGLIR